MENMKTDVTDFKIAWNNFGVNTVCPICGERTDPSINFQIQTPSGDAICEDCVFTEATDLAEVLYAYFLFKYPDDEMVKISLERIKEQQSKNENQPKIVSFDTLSELKETINGVIIRGSDNVRGEPRFRDCLVTKKWYRLNKDLVKKQSNAQKLYKKALEEGAIIAESHD